MISWILKFILVYKFMLSLFVHKITFVLGKISIGIVHLGHVQASVVFYNSFVFEHFQNGCAKKEYPKYCVQRGVYQKLKNKIF